MASEAIISEETPAGQRQGGGTRQAYEASLEFFLAPLLPLLRDPSVSEIMVNGPAQVFVERQAESS